MKIHLVGNMVHLEGRFTRAEMTYSNIDSMTVLMEQIASGGDNNVQIDCEGMVEVDTSGLHFIAIWLHGFKLRGMATELLNLPARFHNNLQAFTCAA